MSRKVPRISNEPSTSQISRSQKLKGSRSSTGLTQTRIDEHCALSETTINDLVNNCVRYFVNNAGQHVYFRKAEIQRQVFSKIGQHFQQVIENTETILKNVYGYNLLVCDQTQNTSKAFIVSNAMPYISYNLSEEESESKDVRQILLLLILSHLYMSNCLVTEAALYAFLSHLKIDINKKHPLFGLVREYIGTTLVKQKYLSMETDPITKKSSFSWGIRAEKEISKHEILKFVSKIYKDHPPKSWTNQFQTANEQGFENDRLTEENSMDIDDE